MVMVMVAMVVMVMLVLVVAAAGKPFLVYYSVKGCPETRSARVASVFVVEKNTTSLIPAFFFFERKFPVSSHTESQDRRRAMGREKYESLSRLDPPLPES
ncbi:hypothetical protein V1477_010668 [Vespula maculifrons]|uniref:Secreted protein n=1 Tax=Vespula maculifrons TaxID=7453 RepID=A0ABD2C2Q0_VESMC